MSQLKAKGIASDAINASKILDGSITNTDLANMATQTIKGRTTAGTGAPEDLTATQATAILNNFVGDTGGTPLKGLVPPPTIGDAALDKFLSADGTWKTLGDLSVGTFLKEDFDIGTTLGRYVNASTGTGAAVSINGTLVSTNRAGIVVTSTGTTTTGRGSAAAGFYKLGGGAAYFRQDVYFPDLSTVTEEYTFDCGIADQGTTSVTPTEGVWFLYDRLTSTNWIVKNGDGTTTTTTTTSTAVTEDTWIRLEWVLSSANDEIEFFINGVSVATHTTNISTGAGNVRPMFRQIKSAGTTARSCHNDMVIAQIIFNTPR